MAADPHTHQDDPSTWPPGTVTLEELRFATEGTPEGFDIVLVPTPSADVNDPLNWKPWEKRLNFGLTLLYSLVVFALISAITPTWAPMMEELGFTLPDVNNSYATGTATLAVGALLFIPFALRYGRRPIYIFSLVGQIAVAVWAANIKNKGDLYGIQAMNCLLGALVEVIVQMTIADIFFVHQRGLMNNLYVCVMSVGTSMAGLVAGYITVGQSWRWVWWWFAIALAICLVAFIFFYEETRFVQQIDGVAEALAATKVVDRTSKGDDEDNKKSIEDQLKPVPSAVTQAAIPRKTYLQRLTPFSQSTGSLTNLLHHVYQPLMVMCTIPAVIYVALLYGFVTAALQVSLTLIASYMPAPPYNFNAAAIGLMSLPVLIGNFVGFILSAPFSDRIILLLARRNKGIYEPEMRLWLLLGFAPFFSGGLILFGYALAKGMSWPIVALGLGISSAALTPIASVSLAYLTDAYTDIIADAVVGVTFVRNALATTFVLALTPWVAQVQLQNVMLTFGMLTALILCGGTVVMLVFGKRLRIATVGAYQFYAKKQIDTRQ